MDVPSLKEKVRYSSMAMNLSVNSEALPVHKMINLTIPIISSSFVAFVYSGRYRSFIFVSPAGVMLCSTNVVISKSSTIFLLE
jgi:hypothetical protein